MRILSSPSGGGSGGDGGDELQQHNLPCVDRSMVVCRPVDGRAEGEVREKKAKRKRGKENWCFWGLRV